MIASESLTSAGNGGRLPCISKLWLNSLCLSLFGWSSFISTPCSSRCLSSLLGPVLGAPSAFSSPSYSIFILPAAWGCPSGDEMLLLYSRLTLPTAFVFSISPPPSCTLCCHLLCPFLCPTDITRTAGEESQGIHYAKHGGATVRTGYEKSRPWPCQEKGSLQIEWPALNFKPKLGSRSGS